MKKRTITSAKLRSFINSDDLEFIVQKNSESYKRKWSVWLKEEKYISLKDAGSWNWCAFLFSSYWLIYRKMYRELAFFLVILIMSNVMMLFLYVMDKMYWDDSSIMLTVIVGMVLPILKLVYGIRGDSWYLRRCLKLVDTANQQFGSSALIPDARTKARMKADRKDFLHYAGGGTNLGGMLGYLGISFILEFVVEMSLLTAFKLAISILVIEAII